MSSSWPSGEACPPGTRVSIQSYDAHRVERGPGRREAVEGRRERCRGFVGHDRVEHRREIDLGLRLGVVAADEVVGVLGAAPLRREQIVERQAEALRQFPDGRVAGVDQLAAPLGHLAAGEVARVAEHPPADAARRLVHGGRDVAVGELERAGEPGDAAADDRHRGVAGRRSGAAANRGLSRRPRRRRVPRGGRARPVATRAARCSRSPASGSPASRATRYSRNSFAKVSSSGVRAIGRLLQERSEERSLFGLLFRRRSPPPARRTRSQGRPRPPGR